MQPLGALILGPQHEGLSNKDQAPTITHFRSDKLDPEVCAYIYIYTHNFVFRFPHACNVLYICIYKHVYMQTLLSVRPWKSRAKQPIAACLRESARGLLLVGPGWTGVGGAFGSRENFNNSN